ncbi:MAG: quinone-dependent dihydroorotate dehydrogenase [Pseudomonadota bacterium]
MTRTATQILRKLLSPEQAHRMALEALARGVVPGSPVVDPLLKTSVWGLDFPNPVGIAAGFDKNAKAPDALLKLGAGFVEIGAVTPRPQAGNPQPRVFRLAEDQAVINRMGFNNDGLERIRTRLAARQETDDAVLNGIIGANLGANKDSPDRMADYETVLEGLWGLCAFYTVNVSSPNTERLRDLQGKAALHELLGRVIAKRDDLRSADLEAGPAPVLLKIAPDLTDPELADVAEVALSVGLDGIVATNTTLQRPDTLQSGHRTEMGGLSGAPLRERSTDVLRRLAQETAGAVPLIGVGGIDSGEAAYEKIRAGASLVQLYTAMVYEGPSLVNRINRRLAALLRRDGFASVAEAVGTAR